MRVLIEEMSARQIIDSRANPTIALDMLLTDGTFVTSSVPSGASKGKFEAFELRDNNPDYLFSKSVLVAIDNINKIIYPKLKHKSPFNQYEIDTLLQEIDATSNFSKIGANAALAVSMAVCQAASKSLGLELFQYIGGINALSLPIPMINIINGGVHANNNLDFQEFMIVPSGAKSFSSAIKMSLEIFNQLKEILKKKNLSTNVGDEGGFAPQFNNSKEAIEIILDSIFEAGYTTDDVKLALDIAASEFYCENKYYLKGENKTLDTSSMIEYIEDLLKNYPIISIEDPLAQDDKEGWMSLSKRLNSSIMLVGDDLFTTNPILLQDGIQNKIANSILIKPNQIGTISKTLECVDLAKRNCYKTIVSHRSGETESTFIADLAVGLNCGFIKTGSLSRTERTAKYNRLLYIETVLAKVQNI